MRNHTARLKYAMAVCTLAAGLVCTALWGKEDQKIPRQEVSYLQVQRNYLDLQEKKLDDAMLLGELSEQLQVAEFVKQDKAKAERLSGTDRTTFRITAYHESQKALYTLEIAGNFEQVKLLDGKQVYVSEDPELLHICESIFAAAQGEDRDDDKEEGFLYL